MDFFVDTGIIIGYADLADDHFHKPCKKFVETYKFKKNGYYSNVGIIDAEVTKKQLERRSQRTGKVFRLFMDRARIFREHLIDASYEEHILYNSLFDDIHKTLKENGKPGVKMDHDAKLLTSSYVWELVEQDLAEPHFVTTDIHDIYNNKELLEKNANSCLSCNTGLTIEFVRNLT